MDLTSTTQSFSLCKGPPAQMVTLAHTALSRRRLVNVGEREKTTSTPAKPFCAGPGKPGTVRTRLLLDCLSRTGLRPSLHTKQTEDTDVPAHTEQSICQHNPVAAPGCYLLKDGT